MLLIEGDILDSFYQLIQSYPNYHTHTSFYHRRDESIRYNLRSKSSHVTDSMMPSAILNGKPQALLKPCSGKTAINTFWVPFLGWLWMLSRFMNSSNCLLTTSKLIFIGSHPHFGKSKNLVSSIYINLSRNFHGLPAPFTPTASRSLVKNVSIPSASFPSSAIPQRWMVDIDCILRPPKCFIETRYCRNRPRNMVVGVLVGNALRDRRCVVQKTVECFRSRRFVPVGWSCQRVGHFTHGLASFHYHQEEDLL